MVRMDEKNKAKAEAFIKEYGELVAKHKMDFIHFPAYMPDGQGGYRTIIQSMPVEVPEESLVVTK